MAKEILVVAELLQDKISDITYEMLGVGRKLANDLHVPCLHALKAGINHPQKKISAQPIRFFLLKIQ